MKLHFGYNCKYYIPTMNKCRINVDDYMKREDLVEKKWLSSRDLLPYLSLSHEKLIEKINEGEIKVKAQKDGKLMFGVLAAWQYDDCPLGNSGGQCFYFEPHEGKHISCLLDLDNLDDEHPNTKSILSEEEIGALESQIMQTIGGQLKYI